MSDAITTAIREASKVVADRFTTAGAAK
jgi:hypothetical protein